MNNNALVVLLGFLIILMGIGNFIDSYARNLTSVLMVIIGMVIIAIGIFSDNIK